MTIQELLRPYELSPKQRDEMFIAYDENPEGFERLCKRAQGANNPPAALTSMVRQGQHMKSFTIVKGGKPESTTLDDLAEIGMRSFNARTAKYPPIDERGWTLDDAIAYAVHVASTWNGKVDPDDIERALRIRIGHPWTTDSDPRLRTITGKSHAILSTIAEAFS